MDKIQGKFYPLQHEEVIKIFTELTKSQSGVLLYIQTLDPDVSGINIKANLIASALNISRNAVYEAISVPVEVTTTVGRIDLLTATEIIEIKEINEWKEALGKLLAYSSFFPQHNKRIHLFGRPDLSKLTIARATCKEFNITVTFEEA